MIFGEGIARENCLLDMGVSSGVLEKAGTWILYKTDRLGQGREQARIYLKENLPFADQLEKAIRAKVLGGAVDETAAEPKTVAKEKETPKLTKSVKV